MFDAPPSQSGDSIWTGRFRPRGPRIAVARRNLTSSRGTSVLFGFALLAGFALMYVLIPEAYIFIIRLWMPLPLRVPFADTAYVMAQLECWRAGIDVYVSNPCDIFGRTQAYPPIWLRLWFLPGSPRASVPLALLLAVGFIISLAVLPRIERKRDVILLLAAIASPVTGFAVERGNADLLIFILAAIVVITAELSFPGRCAGYVGGVLAALLKLYPIFLLALLFREKPRVAAAFGLVLASLWLSVAWLWHTELAHALANLPRPPYWYDGPGARKLAEGLLVAAGSVIGHAGPDPRAVTALSITQLLAAGACALLLACRSAFTAALGTLNSREDLCLVVGGLLFCGCFVAGVSIAYREIFLLFALPALLRLRHDARLPPLLRWAPGMIVFLMWSTLPSRAIDRTFGPLDEAGGPVPTLMFWLLCELMWWWLFVLFGSILLRFVGLPPIMKTWLPGPVRERGR